MLIGGGTPQLMPVPQSVTIIQSPQPMMQVTPAAFQPVPYFPATVIPAGTLPGLDFVPVDLPQLALTSQGQLQPVIQQPSVGQTPISVSVGGDKPVDVKIGQPAVAPQVVAPQVVVPYTVNSRNGGMIAVGTLQGLGDMGGSGGLTFLDLLAIASFLIFSRKR